MSFLAQIQEKLENSPFLKISSCDSLSKMAYFLFCLQARFPERSLLCVVERNTDIFQLEFILKNIGNFFQKDIPTASWLNFKEMPEKFFPLFVGIQPGIAFIHAEHMIEDWEDKKDYQNRCLTLRCKNEENFSQLGSKLQDMGYERISGNCSEAGQYALKGEILEIWPQYSETKVRISFFGTYIEEIFLGENTVSEITIHPKNILLQEGEGRLSSWIESQYITIALHEAYTENLFSNVNAGYFIHAEKQKDPKGFNLPYTSLRLQKTLKESKATLPDHIKQSKNLFAVAGQSAEDTFRYYLHEENIPQTSILTVADNRILAFDSFFDSEKSFCLLRDSDCIHVERSKQKKQQIDINFIAKLQTGDPVVHIDHGIGIFQGMLRHTIDGVEREYFDLHYAEGDRLMLPIDQAEKISRYFGSEHPKIHRLGGNAWAETQAKIKEDAMLFAQELLQSHAVRFLAHAEAFPQAHPQEIDIAKLFPHQETDDQLRSIDEVIEDLGKNTPMDRLVCGDVGFGKTEVAVRAASRVILNGWQVALLCPTTLLAQQHFDTLSERFHKIGISVELLSRFRSGKQQKESIDKIRKGETKIVVGTHRLLSKDVSFKKLGLLIVDEEQKFGVKHKEQIKELRTGTHILTLSATPIPRTLHFSLSGLRDVSVIATAPGNRKPVETKTKAHDTKLIHEYLQRELKRNGQSYYLYNKVEHIQTKAAEIQDMFPEARVGVIHGQLPEHEIAETMHAFDTGKIDILICSTIIENGLDVPNANTLIVEESTHFGLSQLHQIRGRIGRSDVQAYALFCYQEKFLDGIAAQRLLALQESSSVGGGFQLALQDMEIRGIGNMVGKEQHGRAHLIGMHLYNRLLQHAIAELRDGKIIKRRDVRIELGLNMGIGTQYITEEQSRLQLYQFFSSIEEQSTLYEEFAKIQKLYGAAPLALKNFIDVLEIKILCQNTNIQSIDIQRMKDINEQRKEKLCLTFDTLDYTAYNKVLEIQPEWKSNETQIKVWVHDLGENWIEKLKIVLNLFQKE